MSEITIHGTETTITKAMFDNLTTEELINHCKDSLDPVVRRLVQELETQIDMWDDAEMFDGASQLDLEEEETHS